MATKQKVPTGAKVKFLGYAEEGTDGPLEGKTESILIVTGFDKEDGTYNVQCEDDESIVDSLYDDEFEEVKQSAKKQAAKKEPAKQEPAPKEAAKKEQPKKQAKKQAKQEEKPAKAETKPAKKVAKKMAQQEQAEPELLPFKKTATVASTLKEFGGDAVAAAYGWAEEVEKSNFVLGGLLALIKRGDLQTTVDSTEVDEETGETLPAYQSGLVGFNTFVKDYLGIKAVKAHWLVRIYETFSQIATEAQITAVGWTKLRELLPLGDQLTKENVGEWLDRAKEETTDDLHEAVKSELVEAGGKTHGNKKTSKQISRKFVFFDHQAEVVEQAIERKKQELDESTKGDYPDSAALYAILSEWLDLQDSEG